MAPSIKLQGKRISDSVDKRVVSFEEILEKQPQAVAAYQQHPSRLASTSA